MNIYLKIDSIIEQKNKYFNDRYEVIETKDGRFIKPKLGFVFTPLPQDQISKH